MRPAHRPGTRMWLLLPAAAALVLSGLAAGCSSSKPAYCTAADQLKTSVQDLGNVNVVQNGLSSLQTALTSVKTNTTTLANEAQSTFAPQITALQNSLSGLQTAAELRRRAPETRMATWLICFCRFLKSKSGKTTS